MVALVIKRKWGKDIIKYGLRKITYIRGDTMIEKGR